jgi:acyl-CoA synthetase (AMP-forming)/AMP-acid ligase II
VAGSGTVPRMVQGVAAQLGTETAFVEGDLRLSFADVETGMIAVARSLIARGVEPGDRVAVWAPNSIQWIVAALGTLAARAVLVPLNTRLKGDEAASILSATDAHTLFVTDGFLGTDYTGSLRAVAPTLRALEDPVHLPAPVEPADPGWNRFVDSGNEVSESRALERVAAAEPADISDIIFTSGTTGLPKGVMLRHDATLEGYRIFSHHFGLQHGDRYVIPTPFFHCFGYKAGWLSCLMRGAVGFPLSVFDPERVLTMIDAEGITHMPGPPTMFSALLDHPRREEFDLSSLRHAIIGATIIPAALVRRMRQDLGIGAILSAYGLTENHALGSFTAPEDPPEVVATTVGRPLPGVEMRLVDDARGDVAAGEEGEILIRGPFLFSGYYGDEAATEQVLVDGWLHTGDVGRFDEEGLLHITDRKKDMFIVGGFNVAPAEVEKALLGMDGVAQVAVVGMPDDYFGEVGAAFVVPDADATITSDAVTAYARLHLANFKVPRRVEFVDALPLNATGKVIKAELRRRLGSQHPVL